VPRVHRRLVALLATVVAAVSLSACEPLPTDETVAAAEPTSAAVEPTTAPAPTPATATATPTRQQPTTTTPAPKPTPGLAAEAALVPVVGVVDGDTLKVRVGGRTERLRVIGIDTPELASGDCYAQQASSRMQSLVQSKKVRLVADPTQANRDRYDRLLRHVLLADGRSVAQLLIAGGFGKEYTYDRAYYGQGAYRKAQASAREKHLGIWSSGCTAPPPAPLAQSGTCSSPTIKGNISSEGERIYHVPGGQFYAVTKISTAKGERWFCTEAQARAAGWRASER
jgi:micrococcal nuclease